MNLIPARPQRQSLVPPGGVEHHVRDMTATFAADVTLEAAQTTLGEQQQWLPIDGDPGSPLGRLVERNSTGPLRLGYGAWRDLLLGCQFTNGRGELITAGGRTVKNVAGYDLAKFMVGQHGIFGRIVTITTRTYRRPEAALLATFEPHATRLGALLTTPARPQWSAVTDQALLCGYLGGAQTVAFYETELPRHQPVRIERRSVDEDVRHRHSLWTHCGFRASVPPAGIDRFIRDAQPAGWTADAAFGVIVGSCDVAQRSTFQRAAQDAGGSILFFDPSGLPAQLTSDPGVQRLCERLKIAFDPTGALNAMPVATS